MGTSSALRGKISRDARIWDDLKQAISSSSGFQSWRSEQNVARYQGQNLDYLVRHYLRETLETLAY
ncbi:MAG: hypothetical protein F6J89_33775 [Symploca sp. SIO1C4]|uniref:Uncharacterized protein n=1 Tax=Symploca sp. SIO1C4 TaxID=2607765 RepID=A0A6B3NSN6_9CYAN|nr:hypothetical protein [Symploca sp. SIO1C4]